MHNLKTSYCRWCSGYQCKAKSDAKFTDIKTGNTELDKVLDKAISLGKSQQTSTTTSSSQRAAQTLVKQASNPTTETSPSSSIHLNETTGYS